jgi:hypothetical protein
MAVSCDGVLDERVSPIDYETATAAGSPQPTVFAKRGKLTRAIKATALT